MVCLSTCGLRSGDALNKRGASENAAPMGESPISTLSYSGNEARSISPEIKDVVQNKKKFFCTETGKLMYFKDFRSDSYLFVNDDGKIEYTDHGEREEALSYSQFCVIDMDGDGIPELILEESHAGTRLLFHCEDGVVYGYTFPFRGMNGPKADATFIGSNGATINDVLKIQRFSKGEVIFDELCCQNGFDNVYRIDGKNVSPEATEAYIGVQFTKTDVEWYPYGEACFG